MSNGVMQDSKLKLRDLPWHTSRLFGGLEHLKIEKKLIDESFTSEMGESVTLKW